MSNAILKTERDEVLNYSHSYGENYNNDVNTMPYVLSSSTSKTGVFDNETWYGTNSSNWNEPLPIDMQFNDGHKLQIVVYRYIFYGICKNG